MRGITRLCSSTRSPPAPALMRVAGELQELHLLQLNPHQFKALGLRDLVAKGVGEGGLGIEGGPWLGPAPEAAGAGMELLPVLGAGALIARGVHAQAMAPEPELRSRLGQ